MPITSAAGAGAYSAIAKLGGNALGEAKPAAPLQGGTEFSDIVESLLTNDLAEVVEHADVLVVGQEHKELAPLHAAKGANRAVMIDLVSLDQGQVEHNDNDYKGICW